MIKDVEPLLKECEETLTELESIGEMEGACYVQGFINSINKLPEIERPHGEWLRKNNSNSWFECSVCKEVSDVVTIMREPTWHFCPNCGASMISSNSEIEKSNDEKSCLNCGTSEQECELGNRARYGFCGNWTMKEGEAE